MKILLNELISEIRDIYLTRGDDGVLSNEDWYLYTSDEVLALETVCLVSDPVDVDEDTYEEIIPEIAAKWDMINPISCETINDVIINVLRQNKHAPNESIVDAINHYIENDSFMNL